MTKPTDAEAIVLDEAVNKMVESMQGPIGVNTTEHFNLAGCKAIIAVVDNLLTVLFPGYMGSAPVQGIKLKEFIRKRLQSAATHLFEQCERAYRYHCITTNKCELCDCHDMTTRAVQHLMDSLSRIREVLVTDIQAAYDGDPAAQSYDEIIMSYPCIEAITIYRIAHALYENQVPIIPRVMTEYAHARTGIDIHPGATIGERFFIDHGTGVVIGETTTIGENVKIYQGVTLGALSFPLDKEGKPVKGIKRHPDIEDNVVIYAEATILGGKTRVGRGSLIGGNVWLTHSVPPDSIVYNEQPHPKVTVRRSK
ncbi:MAG: serine acetyltransferase [bacterium]|nr:serine acetyltransferase [bacterium]